MLKRTLTYIANLKYIKYIVLRLIFAGKHIALETQHINFKSKIGNYTTILEGSVVDHLTSVGKYAYIGRNCYLTKVSIGNYCSIANNVSIGQGEHSLSDVSTSAFFYENSYEKLTERDCVVGNDVWIGVDAIVLRGVNIGDGAVIGANSVVTRDVPAFAVVVGSPARVIKYRFDEGKCEKILGSKWWDFEIEEAKNIVRGLSENQ